MDEILKAQFTACLAEARGNTVTTGVVMPLAEGIVAASIDQMSDKDVAAYIGLLQANYPGIPLEHAFNQFNYGFPTLIISTYDEEQNLKGGLMMSSAEKKHTITEEVIPHIAIGGLIVEPESRLGKKGKHLGRKLVHTAMSNIEGLAAALGHDGDLRVIWESEEAAWTFWEKITPELLKAGFVTGEKSIYSFTQIVREPGAVSFRVAETLAWDLADGTTINSAIHRFVQQVEPDSGYELPPELGAVHPKNPAGKEITQVRIASNVPVEKFPVLTTEIQEASISMRVELVKTA